MCASVSTERVPPKCDGFEIMIVYRSKHTAAAALTHTHTHTDRIDTILVIVERFVDNE